MCRCKNAKPYFIKQLVHWVQNSMFLAGVLSTESSNKVIKQAVYPVEILFFPFNNLGSDW